MAHAYPPPAGYGAPPPAGYPAPGYGHAPPAAPHGYPGAPPPEAGYSGWAPCYGSAPPAGYSAPPPGYGAPPPAAGYPPPAYPGYGAPPAGYPPPAYPGYGAPPPPGYGLPGYGALDRELGRSSRHDDRDRSRDRDRGQRGQKRKPKPPGQVDGGRKEDGNKKGGKGDKGKGKGKGDKDQKAKNAGASGGSSQDNKPAGDAKSDKTENEGSKPPESSAVVSGDSGKGDSKGSGKSKEKKGDGKGKGDGGMKGKGGGKGKGKVALKISWGEPCFVGVLRKFNIEKKVGVISSAEAYSMCGGMETYAFGSVLEAAKIGLGDTFVFFVHWSKWGEPQASHELLRITALNGMAMKGKFKKAGDASGEKDFGFIDCPEAREYFQRDIYVHKDLMIGLENGQWVSFNAKLNQDMKVECTEVQGCDESWTPPPGDLTSEQEAEGVGPSWDFSAIYGARPARPKYDNNPKPTGEFFTAEFTSYIETRGFGFVGSDALRARFGQDLFAHHKELSKIPDKVAGAKIYFELGATDDGKFQVMNAVPAASDSAPGAILDLPALDTSAEPPAKKQKTEETAAGEAAATTSGSATESTAAAADPADAATTAPATA